jgi:hypothetical protein
VTGFTVTIDVARFSVKSPSIRRRLGGAGQDVDPRRLSALVNSYWPKEIANFQQQISILERILEER